jgi:REP element-mobilizing transposase RayT
MFSDITGIETITVMPINKKYLAKFYPDTSYHIYNKTNNQELLFLEVEDRDLFLFLLKKYLFPYLKVHTYCLLGNHFHILITVKSLKKIKKYLCSIPKNQLSKTEFIFSQLPDLKANMMFHDLLKVQFSKVFISYTRYFNGTKERKGNLFYRPFKRVIVGNDAYFLRLVIYIHQNPIKHLVTKDFENYHWSSYQEIIGESEFINGKKKVLEVFHTLDFFLHIHSIDNNYKEIANLILEK